MNLISTIAQRRPAVKIILPVVCALTLFTAKAYAVQTPTGIYFDEVSVTTITASGYAATPAFTGLETSPAGVNVAINGVYSTWRTGNTWTTKAAIPTGRSSFATGVIGGRLYVTGGNTAAGVSNSNEEYDPASNTWSSKTAMPTARGAHVAGVINGKLYAIGGSNAGGYLNTNEEYDPVANTWSTKTAMPTALNSFAAGVIGGILYAVGGWDGGSTYNTNEAYDPVLNAWSTKAAMPTTRRALAAGVVNGKLYAIGGWNYAAYTAIATNEEYDPVSNTWATKTAMPTIRQNSDLGAIGGKLYAVGGHNGSVAINTNEEYDPASNTWSTKAPMTTARIYLSVGVIAGKLYALGGAVTSTNLDTNEAYDPGVAQQFTGLTPNTQYSFKAKARSSTGVETAETSVVSTYTLAAVPAAASPVFASVGPSSFILNWLANANPAGTLYRAQISASPAFTTPISSDTYNTNAAFTGLNLGATYYARIAALNGGGILTSYASLGSTTTAVSAMTKPTGIYFDEVSVTTITASGYAATPAFTGLETGSAGVNVAINGTYSTWRNGNKWTAQAAMPGDRSLMLVAVIGSKLYAVGGSKAGANCNVNEEYDSVSNTWSTKTAMPTTRAYLAGGAIGGKVYAVGGVNGSAFNTNEEYDPVSNTWTSKAGMTVARYSLASGVVGNKLYAFGGTTTNGTYQTINEEYDPATNTWSTKASMPTALDNLAAGVIAGKIYAIGGDLGNNGWVATNAAYDPAANSWTAKAAMPTARNSLAVGVAGGKLYAIGGWNGSNLNINEEYDPLSNTWSTKAPMLTAARSGLAAGAIGGKLYVLGGVAGSTVFANNDVYDPGVAYSFTGLTPNTQYTFKAKARDASGLETGESTTVSTYTLAAVPTPASTVFTSVGSASFAANWLPNGNPAGTLYRTQISTSATFIPSISSDTYNAAATFTGLNSGTAYYARVAAINGGGVITSYAALGNTNTLGIVSAMTAPTGVYFDDISSTSIVASGYAAAGFPGLETGSAGVTVARDGVYSTWRNGNKWTTKAAMPTPRQYPSVGVAGGKLYAMGGANGSGGTLANEEYDPVSNTWSSKAAMLEYRLLFSVNAIGGKLYAVGGWNTPPSTYYNINEVYDPESNAWSTKAAMPTARSGFAAGVVDGKLYAIGGQNSGASSGLSTNEAYDPASNTWATKTPMPTARYSLSAGVIGGKLYVVGGNGTENYAYDPAADVWAAKAAVPTNHGGIGGVGAIGGKLYLAGGFSTSYLTTNEEYDPTANTWNTRAPMLTARGRIAAGVVNGKMYVVGGFDGTTNFSVNEEYDPGVAASFSGLTPNTLYSFKAKARDSSGVETAESSTVSTYTLAAIPAAGTPAFTSVSTFSFSANWLPNGNPAGTLYRAQVSASSAFTSVISSDTYNAAAAFSGLVSNTLYYARVAAINANGLITGYLALGSTTTTGGVVNNAPVLAWTGENNYVSDGINPETGYAATPFAYRVKYTDADNDMPLAGYPKVHIKKGGAEITGSPFAMTLVSGAYNTGAIYAYSIALGTIGSDYTYSFEAQDKHGAAASGAPVSPETASPAVIASGGVTLGEVLDNMDLSWTTGGNVNWYGQTGTAYSGGKAAQSGAITNNQESWLQTTLYGPGTLGFYWKVSSEAGYDGLVFYIDGVKQPGDISGEVDWQQKSFPLAAGSHILKWSYTKDTSSSAGLDTAWLDKVTFITEGTVTGGRQEGFKTTLGDNLFNPRSGGSAKVKFNVPSAGRVSLKIYDISGRLVRTLFEGSASPGDMQKDWDGRDDSGHFVLPSVYFLHYTFPGGTEVRKIGVKK